MRKTWLRGRENVQKRYLLVVAGFNLSLLMKELTGYGTPKGAAEAWNCFFVSVQTRNFVFCFVLASHEDNPSAIFPLALIAKPVF
jgi:hypothetical protein